MILEEMCHSESFVSEKQIATEFHAKSRYFKWKKKKKAFDGGRKRTKNT